MGEYAAHEGSLDATGMRFAIAVARFNRDLTEQLLDGAETMLRKHDAAAVTVAWVPGAYELPLAAQRFATSGTVDAVICLGAVVRGETAHFEYVAGEAAAGITRVALDSGLPVIFGVLTVENREQAAERLGGKEGHKGEEAALTAIELVALLRELP
jgi:6,7-dimethyl-8-ribityllumazine synthase